MTTAVETELQKVTKLKAGRDRQAYLEKTVQALAELSKSKFESLSEDAQDWFQRAKQAYTDEEAIPDFEDEEDQADEASEGDEESEADDESGEDGEEGEEEAEGEDEEASSERPTAGRRQSRRQQADDEEGKETMTAKKKANGKAPAAKKKAAAKPAAKAAKKSAAPRALGQGAPTLIKQFVLKNPDMSNTDLAEKLKKAGVKMSPASISTIRSQFRHSIRILHEAGHCKNIPC